MLIDVGLSPGHVALAAELSAATCSLPAIATMEWCDDAARALRALRASAIVSVAIVHLSDTGAIAQVEAVGAAGHDAQGRDVSGEALLPLHAPSLDWSLPPWGEPAGGPRVGVLRDLPGFDRFSGSDGARRWSRLGASDFLVGVVKMPGNVPGRTLVVQFGVGMSGKRFENADAAVLAGVLTPLVARASLAFGPDVTNALSRLTHREREVLDHLTLGKSVKEIAADLARSPHTVHDHVKSLHRKLKATSRGELIARALGHIAACGTDAPARAFRLDGAVSDIGPAPVIVTRPALASA